MPPAPIPTSGPGAAEVAAAREQGDAPLALGLALAAWHRTRHPVVADVVDVLSGEALPRFAAPRVRSGEEFQRAWLEVARQPDELAAGWLARTLMQRLAVEEDRYGILRPDYPQTKYAAYFRRLEALRGRVPDPRLASALCRVLEEAELVVWDLAHTRPIYAPVAELLVAHGDVRCRERLERLRAAPRARKAAVREAVAELIDPLLAALARVEVLQLPDEAAWRRLAPVAPAPRRTAGEEELLEAVYQAPEDDRLRLVYADALQERGDPRGEFIALQLAASPTPAQLSRANALLKRHREAWLGPLAAVLRALRFERGFLQAAELAQNAAAPDAVWRAAASDPRLATVSHLAQGRGSGEHLSAFLLGGTLRNLRRCELPSYGTLPALARPPLSRTVEHLVLPRRGSSRHLAEVGELPLEHLKTLTSTLSLGGSASWLEHLGQSGLLRRLTRLEVAVSGWTDLDLVREVLAHWGALPGLERLAVLSPISTAATPVFAALERLPDGGGLRFTFHVYLEREVLQAFRVLPEGVAEVRVLGAAEFPLRRPDEVRGAAAALGAQLHLG